jgi:asparagine synthetase B (glutamine-hydrolysing)
MKYAIEARSPFQDNFVLANSKNMMSKFDFKILNKDLLRSEFPEVEILGVRTDKAGFTSPVGHWLRNNKEFLASSLDELNKYGVFSEGYLRKLISAPDSGSYQLIMQAWTSLVFARWMRSIGHGVEF